MNKRDANKSPGMERQKQTYLAGMQGVRPSHPFSFFDLESRARAELDPAVWGYVESGAGSGETLDSNQEAFLDWEIVPRIMRDVSFCELGVTLFGHALRSPLLLAPIALQELIHSDAERATARAGASLMMPFILSTFSSTSIEAVAEVMGPMPRWFQLYWGSRKDVTLSMVERAERNGYSAIVLTVDAQLQGWKDSDLQNAYMPLLQGKGLANFFTDPEFVRTLEKPPAEDPAGAVRQFADHASDLTLSWGDLQWLSEQTSLPVLIKGVLHPDDARTAVEHGAAGVIVSNHGGRQVDGAIASLRALPDIAHAVGKDVAVLFDSGIRRASHVIKALALGANAVLVGRPYLYGLAIGGEQGVRDVMLNLMSEFDVTMRLCGYRSVKELSADCLRAI